MLVGSQGGCGGDAARPAADLQLVTKAELDGDGLHPDTARLLRRDHERLERRLGDAALVSRALEEGPDGPAYHELVTELHRYGWGVCEPWVATGLIFGKVAKIGRGVSATDAMRDVLHGDAEERADLVAAAVHVALTGFMREAVRGGGWRVEGGAGLATYFVTRILLEFPNVFRRWAKQLDRWDPDRLIRAGEAPVDAGRPDWAGDPGHTTATRDALLGRFLAIRSRRQREIVVLHYEGYSHEEIMDMTGAVSTKAIESVLGRWRSAERKTTGTA